MSTQLQNSLHPPPPPPRSRPQQRKKPNDDAPYAGPSAASMAAASVSSQAAKRQAADRAEGEPRNKRKKMEVAMNNQNRTILDQLSEPKSSLVEFNKLSTMELLRYLTQFNIVPMVRPSPLLADDPPPPFVLANPIRDAPREVSPLAVATATNRPRREIKEPRRRSSRLLEEDMASRIPILADIDEVHNVLASVAERHFRETLTVSGREEVDTLASFMCAVEKARVLRIRG
ncbi:hypothetical protein AMATHDRAFT_72449 [Amanita thiersii Skay4041]|uniref:Histone deacetylase complex subunit SAP30 Sin3 binding domain-containing protein n=1 Tax=Amanita thiersii Skay4041 TaxID=703135 RepID=A0A2A9NYJ4_9AGAR|nr:hypothetical protein AMATHDRAFT_72449 [Amanita thiersii Skay4041]